MSERYRVEQTGKGFWPYCVRAGNGTRDLYVGHKKTCDRVAAELTTAFRDGEFVGKGLYDALAAEAQALREEVAAFEDGMRSLACQLGAGGFNAEKLTAAQLIEKVQWGINNLAETQGRLLDEVRSERDALRARVVVPEGYVLVPVELTRDMWVAVNKEDDKAFAGGCDHGAQFDWLWQAAIEAAPSLKVIAVSIADISARLDAELREWTGDHRKAVERALTDANGRIMAMIEDGNELTEARVDRDELREMVVVVPDRRVLPNYTDHPLLYCEMTGFNNCLDELSRLNGKTVSEGLLRGMGAFAQEIISGALEGGKFDGADLQESAERHGLIAKQVMNEPCRGPEEYCACAWSTSFPTECYRITAELRALLNKDKENGNG